MCGCGYLDTAVGVENTLFSEKRCVDGVIGIQPWPGETLCSECKMRRRLSKL